jgi:hypothetical protein
MCEINFYKRLVFLNYYSNEIFYEHAVAENFGWRTNELHKSYRDGSPSELVQFYGGQGYFLQG